MLCPLEKVMRTRELFGRIGLAMVLVLLGSVTEAEGTCGASSQRYNDCLRLVDSLRPDKAGQARVFAADGSEFTAGQALWMRGQLRKVARLCASGQPAEQLEAARILNEVSELLQSHRRDS
jgi:hypothetical protein